MLVEVGLIVFSNSFSSLRTKVRKKLRIADSQAFRQFTPAILCRHLLLSSFCCHALSIPAAPPGFAHQPFAPRRSFERGAGSTPVESTAFARTIVTVDKGLFVRAVGLMSSHLAISKARLNDFIRCSVALRFAPMMQSTKRWWKVGSLKNCS